MKDTRDAKERKGWAMTRRWLRARQGAEDQID